MAKGVDQAFELSYSDGATREGIFHKNTFVTHFALPNNVIIMIIRLDSTIVAFFKITYFYGSILCSLPKRFDFPFAMSKRTDAAAF